MISILAILLMLGVIFIPYIIGRFMTEKEDILGAWILGLLTLIVLVIGVTAVIFIWGLCRYVAINILN